MDELEMEAARIVERTRVVLDQKFGMQLSEIGTPLHNPRWRIYRPECHEWISAGTVEVEGVGALDHSPTHDKQRCCFSVVFGVDGAVLFFASVDGANLLE